MSDYKKMYHMLFNKITDTIVALQTIQQEAEDIFLSCDEKVAKLSPIVHKKEDINSVIPPK